MKKGFSSDRRKATRLHETPRDPSDAEADEAAAALSSWVSPRVPSTGRRTSFEYERSPTEWMKRTIDDYEEPMEIDGIDEGEFADNLQSVPGSARGRRVVGLATPRVLQRADTPVMSNSSKKATMTPDEKTPPANVQTPYVPSTYSPEKSPLPRLMQKATPLSRNYVQECRAYHEALVTFRMEKQRLLDHMEREKEMDSSWNEYGSFIGNSWIKEEAGLDRKLFNALQEACYGRCKPIQEDPLQVNPMKDVARKEGNFWALLASLRQLGLDALLYAAKDTRAEVRNFVDAQARRVQATPLAISQSLQGPDAPLVLRRWWAVLHWLEACHDRTLPTNITRPRLTATGNALVDNFFPTTTRDSELFRAALNLCLAGRLDDAIEIVSATGLEYKAAQWSGGKPAGKVGNKSVGNPRRALWKSLMWKKAEMVDTKPSDSFNRDEAALAALLSNHSRMAMQNPSLRTWERAFYAATRAVVGRIEDDALQQHNEHRGSERPPYPGTEWIEYEKRHLENTYMVQDMTEARLVQEIMASTPYPEMLDEDPYSSAMTAFWLGQKSIQFYMNDWFLSIQENDAEYLRFLTHLALYFDSLGEGSDSRLIPGVADWKNGIVQKYLDHLASREELWHMMVLYASFLPASVILQSLPTLLMQIDGPPARSEILRQMSLFLEPGLDRAILLEIARRTLEEVDCDDDMQVPSVLDDKKMRLIDWFALRPEFRVDGLVYTNRLLRQFLLEDKVTASKYFVSDICPKDISELLEDTSHSQGDLDPPVDADGNSIMALENEASSARLDEARVEYGALLVYLEAEDAVDYWKGVLASAEPAPEDVDDPLDKTRLNEQERAIAISKERRALADEKRETSHKVTVAANQALEHLATLLKFSGGWLLVEDDDGHTSETSEEEASRREELKQLRNKIIPSIISKYREVCMETALWMSASLDDGVKRLEKSPAAVLGDIDRSNTAESSALAPSYWTKQALRIIEDVTSEAYECLKVLTISDRKDLLKSISDTMVAHLKYTSALGWEPAL